jgi:tetratricopeptide (TPR) repeat protein
MKKRYSPITAHRWQDRATRLMEQKQCDKAIPILAQVAHFFEQNKAWENYVEAANKWAEALLQMRQYKEAEELLQKVLQIGLNISNNENVLFAQTYYMLGTISQRCEEYDKSIDYYQHSLSIYAQNLPEHDPKIANVYEEIGLGYYFKGRFNTAIEYLKKSLAIRIKTFGNIHIMVAYSYTNLGNVFYEKMEIKHALMYGLRSLQIKQKLLGEMHLSTASSYGNLGAFCLINRDFAKAMEYQERSLQIKMQLLGEQHLSMAHAYGNMGIIFYKKQQYDEAENYLLKSVEIIQANYGEPSRLVADAYVNIALIYMEKNKIDIAIAYQQKALAIYLQKLSKKHPDTALCYYVLADFYLQQGKYATALPYYQLALQANSENFNSHNIYDNPPLEGQFSSLALLKILKSKAFFLEQLYQNQTHNGRDLQASIQTYYLADTLIEQMRNGFFHESTKLALSKHVFSLSENTLEAIWLLHEAA